MLSCFHHIVSSHSWHFLCLGHTCVRVGNRFRSQVQDKKVRGPRKNPCSIHIWTSSAYSATDPPGYWVANGRDEERFCLNVTFTGLTIYLERRVGDEAWGKKQPNSFLFRKSRRLFYFLSRNMLKDVTENNDVKGQDRRSRMPTSISLLVTCSHKTSALQ